MISEEISNKKKIYLSCNAKIARRKILETRVKRTNAGKKSILDGIEIRSVLTSA